MSNSFDFELVAGDHVSEAIAHIDEAVRNLEPQLEKTRKGLQLGGQETLDGLNGYNSRLDIMASTARDNVQFIGDMIPPLKIVGEMSSKIAGMGLAGGVVGAAGGVAYATGKLAESYKEAARGAYDLDTHAKNTAMSVQDFSRLSGALQLVGADSESAASSIEGIFKSLNEANSAGNAVVMSAMAQIGAQIEKNKDGSVNTLKTLESIARIFPKLRPDQQKSFANAMGLTPEMLTLLREGSKYAGLLAKADKVGLTVDPALNQQLTSFDVAVKEASASWDGFKSKLERKVYASIDTNGLTDMVNGFTDMLANNFDNISMGRFAGQNKGDDSELMRRALADPEFQKRLNGNEKNQLTAGVMTDEARKKYHQYFYNQDRSRQLLRDVNAITRPAPVRGQIPYSPASKNTPGFRNHNPGNLKAAPNSTGKRGKFSTFASDDDGLSAMARQLMLYGDRGNNTPGGIIHTYAPSSENNTRAYIDDVTSRTRYGADQRLDLHNPEVLKTLMASMIQHEQGSQPYTEEQLKKAIQSAIMDDQWSGQRNPERLTQQRRDIISGAGGGGRSSSILSPADGDSNVNVITENITRSLTDALAEQPLRLEITMINDKGERKTYNVENNGKIITPMNY
ncbi:MULTISPECIES: hypothetical protein [Klebsiella/Raoultella group]|uniref:Uncharacterized protein n=8 Tax=Klebsiella/Raoultella group TaxID=2890311 RepID=A0ABU5LZ97_RAOPL|nr:MULTISPECIES: hypothetical protein [Klebsiella/Raoultella group]HBY7579555.1 hypothetical protein [Klebsiella pneumoniae]EKV8769218.1 hypothetical protein [Klebsiella variicola]EKW0517991.1 hypothetical protein [Klebsiella variicola]MBC5069218.1 hypothetical protein [Klebsiella quasipneumoniae]MBC5149790.1 hypothetical protein [Klebsiella quasipneumoniae]